MADLNKKLLSGLLEEFPPGLINLALDHMAAMKPDHDEFVSYHRKKVRAALEMRKVCPHCENEDQFYKKCSKCKSVSYCNRACQVADWPKHKKICKIYQHVLNTLLFMKPHSLEEFFRNASCECLAIVFVMAGFDAEVVVCAVKPPNCGGNTLGLPVVIAEGKLFNIGREISNHLGQTLFTHDIQPIPNKIPEGSILAKMLISKQSRHTVVPWRIPHDIDEADLDIVKRYACRFLIHQHYLDYEDRPTLLRVYGKFNTIEEATGETTEEFKKRFDEFIKMYGTGNEGCLRLGTVDRICWQQLNISDDTRKKLHWHGVQCCQ